MTEKRKRQTKAATPKATPSEWSWLDELLKTLRAHGVTRATLGPLHLEIGAMPTVPGASPADSGDPGLCRCGHHLVHEHTGGGCLHGCELAICVPQPKGDL